MSCPSYFENVKTNKRSCNGMKPSSDYPSHEMSDTEKKCVSLDQDSWASGACEQEFHNMIFPDGRYSKEGFENAVSDYNYMFYSYFGPYDSDTNPNGGHTISEDDTMSKYLINSCSANQGVCQCVAYNMCGNCKSSKLHENQLLRQLCGCACRNTMSEMYDIDPLCEATCANRTTSKHRNFKTGRVDKCNQKVCFFDTDTVHIFDDSCPHCQGDDCVCGVVDRNDRVYKFKDRCDLRRSHYLDEYILEEESSPNYMYGYVAFVLIIILVLVLVIFLGNAEEKKQKQQLMAKEEAKKQQERIKASDYFKEPEPIQLKSTPTTIDDFIPKAKSNFDVLPISPTTVSDLPPSSPVYKPKTIEVVPNSPKVSNPTVTPVETYNGKNIEEFKPDYVNTDNLTAPLFT